MKYKISVEKAKPFVKWVGGKGQLLEDIRHALPPELLQRKEFVYIEPFVGGGAVLFWMMQHVPNIEKAVINDINPRLIATYRVIKEKPFELLSLLEQLQNEYLPLSEGERKEFYLNKRELYNDAALSELQTAALLIFLNRTCFNGLYRVNSKGEFNVPHGRYAKPRICDKETILADSRILQKVEILCGDFEKTLSYASPLSLFYLDPPYKPLSNTSSFTSYTKENFDDSEQLRLRDFCNHISSLGAGFLLSNSDSKLQKGEGSFFDEIYHDYNIQRVMATRMVNSDPEKRGKLTELLIRNYT